MNNFLDLSIYISHFSSSTCVEGSGENDSRASLQGSKPDRGKTLVTRSVMEMDDRTSDVSPWDVSRMDSHGHHPESPKQEKEEDFINEV